MGDIAELKNNLLATTDGLETNLSRVAAGMGLIEAGQMLLRETTTGTYRSEPEDATMQIAEGLGNVSDACSMVFTAIGHIAAARAEL